MTNTKQTSTGDKIRFKQEDGFIRSAIILSTDSDGKYQITFEAFGVQHYKIISESEIL